MSDVRRPVGVGVCREEIETEDDAKRSREDFRGSSGTVLFTHIYTHDYDLKPTDDRRRRPTTDETDEDDRHRSRVKDFTSKTRLLPKRPPKPYHH